MEKYITKSSMILWLMIFTIYGCGKNVEYIEREIVTNEVNLKRIFCDNKLSFNIKEISVLNTVQDTFLIRSHHDLGINLEIDVFNNDTISKKVNINGDNFSNSNFLFLLENDTINFYNTDKSSEHIVQAKESFSFSLRSSSYYSFEILFGEKKDYGEDMLNLLSNFQLIYHDDRNKICVNQNSKTEVIVYNDKSKWSWW